MICSVALCAAHDNIKDIGGEIEWKTNISRGAAAVRQDVTDLYIANGLEGDELAVVSAMTLGDKRFIDRSLRNEYSRAGVAHVLALSGTHLAFLYFVLMLIVGWSRVGRFVVIATIWCYVVIVGMPVSAVRAAIMLSIFTLTEVLKPGSDRLDVLVTTIMIMVLVNPRIILDVGFQLSIMSVGAIIVICPLLNGLLPPEFHSRHHYLSKIWGMVSVGLAAQLGTAPLVAFYFHSLPCWFIISNLIVVPLTTLLLYGALAIVMLWPLSFIQLWLVKAAGLIAWVMNVTVEFISQLPLAAIDGIRLSVLQVIICYILIAVLLKIIDYLQIKI
ncbi:MAG: ComEC/Rec2 family competence protein [Prevotella sp.]|nr:ComEC/Rec2 family competence protein [Prevotella sp.]